MSKNIHKPNAAVLRIKLKLGPRRISFVLSILQCFHVKYAIQPRELNTVRRCIQCTIGKNGLHTRLIVATSTMKENAVMLFVLGTCISQPKRKSFKGGGPYRTVDSTEQ